MQDKIGFSLRKITTEQFATIESAFNNDVEVKFSVNTKYGINKKERMLAVFTTPTFYQSQSPFLILEICCHFKIVDDAWDSFINKNNSKITFPIGFVRHLTMLTIGTARGVLHSKTENTMFNEFLLPTINVAEIIKSSISFDLIE